MLRLLTGAATLATVAGCIPPGDALSGTGRNSPQGLDAAVVAGPVRPARSGGLRLSASIDAAFLAERSVADWVAALSSSDADQRAAAALAIAAMEPPPSAAVPGLMEAATAPEAYVRRLALRALATFGSDALPACDVAIRALDDADPSVCHQALEVLAHFGPAALPALSTLLARIATEDGFPDLGVIEVLGAIGPAAGRSAADAIDEALDTVRESWGGRRESWRVQLIQNAIDRIRGPESVRDRVVHGSSGQWHWLGTWERAANDLAHDYGRRGVELLAGLSQHARSEIRLRGVTGLGGASAWPELAIPPLLRALADSDEDVRKEAAYMLRQLASEHPRVVAAFRRLRAGSPDGRALAELVWPERPEHGASEKPEENPPPRRSLDALVEAIESSETFMEVPDWVRPGNARLRAQCLARLATSDPNERVAVAGVLARVDPHAPGLLRALVRPEEFAKLADPAIDSDDLGPVVGSWISGTRRLGTIQARAREVVPLLVTILERGKCLVGPSAAFALGDLGFRAAPAVASLKVAARSRWENLRVAAICALGEIGDARGVSVLIAAIERRLGPTSYDRCGCPWSHDTDGEDAVTWQALRALASMGPTAAPAAPALRAIVVGPNEYYRQLAVRALRAIQADSR